MIQALNKVIYYFFCILYVTREYKNLIQYGGVKYYSNLIIMFIDNAATVQFAVVCVMKQREQIGTSCH